MILTPAWARIIQLLDGDMSRLMRNNLAMLPADALVVAAMVWDSKTRGHLSDAIDAAMDRCNERAGKPGRIGKRACYGL